MKNTTEMHFNKHVDQVAGRDIYNMSPPTEELFSRPDDRATRAAQSLEASGEEHRV